MIIEADHEQDPADVSHPQDTDINSHSPTVDTDSLGSMDFVIRESQNNDVCKLNADEQAPKIDDAVLDLITAWYWIALQHETGKIRSK